MSLKHFRIVHTSMCCAQSLGCLQLFATPQTAALQAPLFMGFSRQEYWSGLSRSPPRDLPDQGIERLPVASPALAGRFFTSSATQEAMKKLSMKTDLSKIYVKTLLAIYWSNHMCVRAIKLQYLIDFQLFFQQYLHVLSSNRLILIDTYPCRKRIQFCSFNNLHMHIRFGSMLSMTQILVSS